MNLADEWSEPTLVRRPAPVRHSAGEIARIRQQERRARRARWRRLVWPAVVLLLVLIVGTCLVLLPMALRMG